MIAEAEAVSTTPRSKALRYVGLATLWLFSGLLGLGYLAAGWSKFDSFWVTKFVGYGYPAWFTYVVGVAEMAGGALLFIPKLAVAGAALLAGIMLGATVTHIIHGEINWSFTLILMAIFVGIGVARWKLAQGVES